MAWTPGCSLALQIVKFSACGGFRILSYQCQGFRDCDFWGMRSRRWQGLNPGRCRDVGTAGPRVETPALAGLETSEAPKVRLPRRTTAMCLPHIVCSGFRVFGPNVMDFTATGTTAGTIPTAATTHHAPPPPTPTPTPTPTPRNLAVNIVVLCW